MRIENLRRELRGGRVRGTATVVWEDSGRPPLELFFETGEEQAGGFEAGPNAFLLACILPAFRRGEKRLRIEGEVCPRLRDGVGAAMALLGSWYRPEVEPVKIEATRGFQPPSPAADRAAFFVTGGIDSLHTLWRNRRDFPASHPASIRAGINVPGLSFPEETPSERSRDLTARTFRALRALARDADFEVLWAATNVRGLEHDTWFLAHEAHSSVLAAVAHTFAARLTAVHLASSFDLAHARPWGSHPLLDPNYSSCSIELYHDGLVETRLERLRRISSWQAALDNLVVCFEGPVPDGALNCGKCEKCVRTMVMLTSLGRLERAGAFPCREVTEETVEEITIGYHPSFFEMAWSPLVAPLRSCGRSDLVGVIERKIEEARRFELWRREDGWKGRLRRIDRRVFGGRLLRLRRAFR
jgi:hypothetical protein